MNVTRYLKNRKDKKSRQVIFEGEKLDMEAVWKVRDAFFAPMRQRHGMDRQKMSGLLRHVDRPVLFVRRPDRDPEH